MTEVDTTPPDRVEPVDIQVEMQRSYLDYAMSVIVGRALPDVRDGLKPVHRRVLYAMYDGGYRPDRGYVKCARVVGDVMGNYHPHGDTAIYDTLVRLAQPWSMREPLVDGNGNFGSQGDDPPAAMRYCVTGDTLVELESGPAPIDSLVPDASANSDTDIDVKVRGRGGALVPATRFFHSGVHPTLTLRTRTGHELTGTANHPVLCLVNVAGVPMLLWRLLSEIQSGDWVAMARGGDAGRSHDHVPFVAEYIRTEAGGTWADRDWLNRHNIDRIERWEQEREEIVRRIGNDEVRRVVAPLVDGSLYYAQITSVNDAGRRPVYSLRVDSEDHAFITNGFISHNTECRLAPLAMEMLRDIDQETVDFVPNYDGQSQEPLVLPSRIPNLLVNGGAGIAVGMATNIPTHNLREVTAGVQWFLQHPDASDDELLSVLMQHITGPDFPTGALIVGREGIEDAYRTGRGSIRMRAVVEVEEDRRGRQTLVVGELPYQVNKDSLLRRIGELVDDGKVTGIADLADEGSARTGLRLVITLKRDAVAKVVLNNLYKHTQLQDTFGVNMVALVDGVPRTLNLAQLVRYYVGHQVEVIVRRTRYQLRKAEERAHILRALLKALDALDEVIALIRRAESAEVARGQLMEFLEIDEVQATAILDMQLRRLAALERQRIIDEYAELTARIEELNAILASPDRQREIIGEELAEIAERYGNERRTRIVPYEGDVSLEDLIAEEEVVVTISRTGYAKRTKTDLYRQQRRGGKGVQGAALRQDDIVEHFFVTSTHNWILFFTNKGRVYRAKAHELPETTRAARGQHVANILAFQPDERIAQVIDLRGYDQAPYLVLATRHGLVKKTPLREFDSARTGGIIAVNLRGDDEVISAALIGPENDLLLVSRQAQSIRFHANDESLRPMGRATSGVIGMRFAPGDSLLAMEVVRPDADVLVATDGGYAKRTKIEEYPVQGRGGKGVLTAKIVEKRGSLVGALIVKPEDEVFAITSSGGVIRTRAREVRRAQRQTMGVRLIHLPAGDTVVGVARNAEPEPEGGE